MSKPIIDPYSPQKSSPNKNAPASPKHSQDGLPPDMQYRLQRVFEQARNREERYIDIIKDQQSKRKEEAEKYLAALRQMKKEFMEFMDLKKPKKEKMWRTPLEGGKVQNKKEVTRLNSVQFSLRTLSQLKFHQSEDSQTALEPRLDCKLTFYYYTPLFKDYIRSTIPQELILTLRTIFPFRQFTQQIQIIKEQDQISTINCLIDRVPFQIATKQNTAITVEFSIPCNQQAINYYRERQFQIELTNKRGMFGYAFAKLDLSSLLFYENQPTEWKLRPLQFYSVFDGVKVGTMAVKLMNRLQLAASQKHYKIQSNTPMQVGTFKSGLSYNDDQSRMIQRISKFKTAHNSLLLGIGPTKEANAQRFFQNENDKMVIMHRKKKQLQSIQEYKNSHKQELMGKLFDDAINRYYLNQCEIGCPKYVVFHYFNQEKQHRRLHLKIGIAAIQKEGGKEAKSVALTAIQENIVVSIVRPQHFQVLIQKKLIMVPTEAHFQYEMDEGDTMWAMGGMSHPIVVRVICFPPKMSVLTRENLQSTYELKLVIRDDYDREVETFHSKLKLTEPRIEHKLSFHGYSQTQTSFEVPFQEKEDSLQSKTLITNHHELVYSWDERWNTLSVKLKHGQAGEKSFYLIVNDAEHLYQIGCYQIVVFSYAKLNKEICLGPGEVKKINLDFTVDEKTLTALYEKNESQGLTKTKGVKDQLRVLFASSKPEHCFVRCHNQSELIIKTNKIYEVQARIQSYDQQTNPQRILIHAVDLDRSVVIKRWLIQIEKEKVKYEKTSNIQIEHGKNLRYRFELFNNDHREKNYRLYSSNLSVLTVPMEMVSMISNQVVTLDLQFVVKQQMTSEELGEPLKIVLTVTDGQQFLYYLFELVVKMK